MSAIARNTIESDSAYPTWKIGATGAKAMTAIAPSACRSPTSRRNSRSASTMNTAKAVVETRTETNANGAPESAMNPRTSIG